MKLKEYWKETIANKDTFCSECRYHIKRGQIILTHYKEGRLKDIKCQGCHIGWNPSVVLPNAGGIMKELEWKAIEDKDNWKEVAKLERDGWRLPTKEELILLYESGTIPSGCWFWSASPYSFFGGGDDEWGILFCAGGAYYNFKGNHFEVGLVKDTI